jgi:multimeric flavodoxin WrbA
VIGMKVVVLHGSAHVGGDTDALAERFLQGLSESGPHEVTHFRPIEMHIEHCRACMQCAGGDGCVIDDDMQDVYPAFCDANIVVMATPMFWGYMTSQLKTLFDRLEAVVSERCFGSKDFVLLIGYRQYFGSMVAWLDRIAGLSGSRSHAIAVQTYDAEAGKDIPVVELPERLGEAKRLGREVAAARA